MVLKPSSQETSVHIAGDPASCWDISNSIRLGHAYFLRGVGSFSLAGIGT